MQSLYNKFEQYLMTEKRVSTNTLQAYQSDLEQAMKFFQTQGCLTFHDVTTEHVRSYLHYLRMVLKVSARSSARKLSSLKSLCKYAQKYHNYKDFTFNIGFPKLEKKLPKFLTQNQITHLFAVAQKDVSAQGQRNYTMITLAYICGVRVSELIQLTRSNVNFDDQLIHVAGKGDKQRIIPIPESCIHILKEYLDTYRPHLCKTLKIDTDYLFPIVYGNKIKPMTRQAFWGILKDVARLANLPDTISPHVLRHSIATHLLKKGAHLRLLQMALGHEQLETVQVYTHVEISHLRTLYDKYHSRA